MKTIVRWTLLLLLLAAPATAGAQADSVSVREVAERIEKEARKHLGKRYRYGANGPEVFDCTGFTRYVYGKLGYNLSRSARDQAHDGRPVAMADLQKGDILVFGARGDKRHPGHAGIFLGRDSTGTNYRFIHACRRGVIISDRKESYYVERYLGARRILPDFPEETPPEMPDFLLETPLALPDTVFFVRTDALKTPLL